MMNKVWKGEQIEKDLVKRWLYHSKVKSVVQVYLHHQDFRLFNGRLDCGLLVRNELFETDYCEGFNFFETETIDIKLNYDFCRE